jgi:hypothetical protein
MAALTENLNIFLSKLEDIYGKKILKRLLQNDLKDF